MNYRLVINQLGLLLIVLSMIMLLMAGVFLAIETALSHNVDSQARTALVLSGGIGLALGFGMWFFTRTASRQIGRREALLLVGTTWLVGAVIAALPYFFWANLSERVDSDHPFHAFTDCYFEAMSGLTTTGASVLTDVEAVPRSLLLWRALTQWLGGLGIVVLFVAVLPAVGTSSRKLFRAETTGVAKDGLRPQIRDTARMLWGIYFSLTLAQILALHLAGMEWFDAICHTFTTLATGGFSTRNASIAGFDSVPIELITILFMVLGGMNFALYYQALRGRWSVLRKDPELRLYLMLMLAGILVVTMVVYGKPIVTVAGSSVQGTLLQTLQYAGFTSISIQTTTGFATAEFDYWPSLATGVMFFLGLVGGCAGSTAGGLKVIRLWIIIKTLHAEIEHAFRPSVMRPIRVGTSTISEEARLGTLAFLAAFGLILGLCTVALMAIEAHQGIDLTTAITGSLACMTTIGPGLGRFGAAENYGWLTPASKWVLSFAMVVGRLEVFTILVLLSPRFWRNR